MVKCLPRLIFWETTKYCNLSCKHCRVMPVQKPDKNELTFEEAKNLIGQICEFEPRLLRFAKQSGWGEPPILVLSGGEPLYRGDIFDIIVYAKSKRITVALATNGTLITEKIAQKMKQSNVDRVSISLDGTKAETHDDFRGQKGSFAQAIDGFNEIKKKGISIQINFTVTKQNVEELDSLINLALNLGADAVHLFFLVPVGCGQTIPEKYKLTPEETENTLIWFYEKSKKVSLHLKATCAPQYQRIIRQRSSQDKSCDYDAQRSLARGCLASTGICFISNNGEVFPCGYLPVSAGNVRKSSLKEIWDNSGIFSQLRDTHLLRGKCGICEYREICTGCRARAYAKTGDYLEEEPECVYQP